jgi:hypothetical protein
MWGWNLAAHLTMQLKFNSIKQLKGHLQTLSLYLQGISIFGKPCWSEGTSGSLSIEND